MPYVHYHPVYLDLKGRRVLIVGAGNVAHEKLVSLCGSGARITLIAPEIRHKDIARWVGEGNLEYIQRPFEVSDVDGHYMIIAATDSPEVNALVFKTGDDLQRLTNSVDDPVNCNFIMSAITRRGPMQVAVSSAGCSPALAQRVRNRVMNEILTEEMGQLAEFLGDRRAVVKERLNGYKQKQAFWEYVIDSNVPTLLQWEGVEAANRRFMELLDRAAVANGNSPLIAKPTRLQALWNRLKARFAKAEEEPVRPSKSPVPNIPVREPGKVFLVGAGPGDPDLITLKGVQALQNADVVLYDRLAHPKLMDHAPATAERIYVGKEVGNEGKGRQRWINEQMLDHALMGKTVVRLKGGDPFVFGRGGEEMVALRNAGVPYEIIPGISSSVAGPAAAGIPVTHRGIATAFGVFAGHESGDKEDLPWAAAALLPTAVFLMGVERLPVIASRLIEAGRNPDTPVAVVSKATLPDQKIVMGSLRTIVDKANGVASPAIIVIGEVVTLSEEFLPLISDLARAA